MKKKFGITFGGLQQKLLNLVLILLLLIIGTYMAVSLYQSKKLSKVVSNANSEQEQSIEKTSQETMYQVAQNSMVKTTALQAYIADDMFAEMKSDVLMLQTLATELFEHSGSLGSHEYSKPDKSKDGVFSAQVLCEDGVDITKSEYLGTAAHMSDTMIAMCKNSNYMTNCYIGLADGTVLCVDDNSANKFDKNGNISSFAVRQRPWYTGAVETGKLYFTGIELDTYTDKIGIECSAPVYVDGKLIGVVGADLFLNAMSDYVESSAQSGGFVFVVNNNGHVIFAPTDNGIFTVQTADKAEDLRKSDNKELADFVTKSLKEKTELVTITIDGNDYYIAGSPMNTVGWAVISVVDKEMTEKPANAMIDEFNKINDKAFADYEQGASDTKRTILVMTALILIFGSAAALFIAGRIVKPVEKMKERMDSISGTDQAFEMDDAYRTGDEIQLLAETLADLSKKTREYIKNITEITKEKERISAELDLARKIQADMLPNIFPPFPERKDIDIFASMTPAKEVGGDFYDFFLIDDDHLGMVMADVSGKGVPAALFMMMSKILINNYALMGNSPSQVLEKANAVICQNNDEEMFVTVWFGVLEISTGRITAANAGHEYPIIRKANGEFEIFKDKHGFVIGGMDAMKYKQYEMTLEKGGTLFLYTDGVAEATNADNELFGTERMLRALNTDLKASPKQLLENMAGEIDRFVGDADQFDDLTMLAVTLN